MRHEHNDEARALVEQLRSALDAASSCLPYRQQRALGEKITKAIDAADVFTGQRTVPRSTAPIGDATGAIRAVREQNPRLTKGSWTAKWRPETHCENGSWTVTYRTSTAGRRWDAEPKSHDSPGFGEYVIYEQISGV